jgi:hypothetical protein
VVGKELKTGSLDQAGRSTGRPLGRPPDRTAGGGDLSLIGAAFLAVKLIDFLRHVDAVIAAGRTGRQPANGPPRRRIGRAAVSASNAPPMTR